MRECLRRRCLAEFRIQKLVCVPRVRSDCRHPPVRPELFLRCPGSLRSSSSPAGQFGWRSLPLYSHWRWMTCWTRPTQKPKQNLVCVHVGLHKRLFHSGKNNRACTSECTLKLICCASCWAWGSTGWRSLLGVNASRAVRMEQPHISQQKSWDLNACKAHFHEQKMLMH